MKFISAIKNRYVLASLAVGIVSQFIFAMCGGMAYTYSDHKQRLRSIAICYRVGYGFGPIARSSSMWFDTYRMVTMGDTYASMEDDQLVQSANRYRDAVSSRPGDVQAKVRKYSESELQMIVLFNLSAHDSEVVEWYSVGFPLRAQVIANVFGDRSFNNAIVRTYGTVIPLKINQTMWEFSGPVDWIPSMIDWRAMAINIISASAATGLTLAVFRWLRRCWRVRKVLCVTCGYPLKGLSSNTCPECGTSINEVRSIVVTS